MNEELHKRIDLMLPIDDVLMRRPRYHSRLLHYLDHIVASYRLHQSVPNSPRLSSQHVTHSTTPVSNIIEQQQRKIIQR